MINIKEIIEKLRGLIKGNSYGACSWITILRSAIKVLQVVESAEGVLPEKKICEDHKYNYASYCRICSNNKIFNQAIDIARPILAKAKLRIGFLELTNRAVSKELQSLKETLTVKKELCPEDCKFIGITEEEQNKYPTGLKPYHYCSLTRNYTRLYHNGFHPRLCRSEKCLYLTQALIKRINRRNTM